MFFVQYSDGISNKYYNCQISQGYYEGIEQLIEEMNRVVKQLAIEIKIQYNVKINKIRMVTDKTYSLGAKGNLSRMLGLEQNKVLTRHEPEAPYPADVHAGFYTMFVYTDIIHYQRVGDSFVPLLRCVHITGENNKIVTLTYDKPHYVPVSKSLISDIVIEVKSDQDKHIPFLYGKFVAKLHFRPAKHSFRV